MSDDTMMQMTITGGTTTEFFAQFDALARRFGYVSAGAAPSTPGIAPLELTPMWTDGIESDKVGEALPAHMGEKRRGRPKKGSAAAAAAPVQQDLPLSEPAAEQEPVKPVKPVTLDDARDAGREIIFKIGPNPLRELLNKFHVGKIADLKQDQWVPFIADCSKVVVGAAEG